MALCWRAAITARLGLLVLLAALHLDKFHKQVHQLRRKRRPLGFEAQAGLALPHGGDAVVQNVASRGHEAKRR
jgi:hypothetical protein